MLLLGNMIKFGLSTKNMDSASMHLGIPLMAMIKN
jgi:hypothetical protein